MRQGEPSLHGALKVAPVTLNVTNHVTMKLPSASKAYTLNPKTLNPEALNPKPLRKGEKGSGARRQSQASGHRPSRAGLGARAANPST